MSSRCNWQTMIGPRPWWQGQALSLCLLVGLSALCPVPTPAQSNAPLPYSSQDSDKSSAADAPTKHNGQQPTDSDASGQRLDNGNQAMFDPQRRRDMRRRMDEMRSMRERFAGAPGNNEQMGRRQGGRGGLRQLDLTSLNLTEQQKEEIKQARQATRQHAREIKQKMAQRQIDMRALLFSQDASEQQIKAARKLLRDCQNQIDEIALEDLLHVRRMLTAEQRKKWTELAPPEPQQSGHRDGGHNGGRPVIGDRHQGEN